MPQSFYLHPVPINDVANIIDKLKDESSKMDDCIILPA